MQSYLSLFFIFIRMTSKIIFFDFDNVVFNYVWNFIVGLFG